MLGKLIKYEIKATARILIPLYIALLVFAFINRLFSGDSFSATRNSAMDIPAVISMIAYGCTMAAVFFITAFIMVQRFYKNLLGDEGYLMNTLPVKAWMNISSKLAVSIIWSIISLLVALLSIFIMAFSKELFTELGKGITEIQNYIPEEYYGVWGEFVFYSFISMIGSALMLFLSISIGHLFSKRRILLSFAAFILLNMMISTIKGFIQLISFIGNQSSFMPMIHILLVVEIIMAVVFFIACNYIVERKLNLE